MNDEMFKAWRESQGQPIDAVHRSKGNAMSKTDELLRPIVGVENRTAQEVFDIMCDRIAAWNRRTAQPAVKALLETLETTAQRLKNAEWEDGASSDHVRRVLREGADVCNAAIAALVSAPADPATAPADVDQGPLDWAVEKWHQEVANRPLMNVHRAALDTTWRQVIHHFDGDPDALCGPDHYELVEKNPAALLAAPAGDVVEALNPDALAALKNGQRQLDQDGVEVGVSRQALDELIAAFEARTALSAQGWRTPDGWKLVPVEPVPEMIGAWYRYKSGHHYPGEEPPRDTSDYGAYRAMIAAAPTAQGGA